MARERKTKYATPIEGEALSAFRRELIAKSPAFNLSGLDATAFIHAFAPPHQAYPGLHKPDIDSPSPNAERDWLIQVLGFLTQCYPYPVNTALDSLKTALIEVNRGLIPNIFTPHKPAKGGKSNFVAQEAMNFSVLAADFIYDGVSVDYDYQDALKAAKVTSREIELWRARIDPAYRCTAIVPWADIEGAKRVLISAVQEVRLAIGRKTRGTQNPDKLRANLRAKGSCKN